MLTKRILVSGIAVAAMAVTIGAAIFGVSPNSVDKVSAQTYTEDFVYPGTETLVVGDSYPGHPCNFDDCKVMDFGTTGEIRPSVNGKHENEPGYIIRGRVWEVQAITSYDTQYCSGNTRVDYSVKVEWQAVDIYTGQYFVIGDVRYLHLDNVQVSVGDYISNGDHIGDISEDGSGWYYSCSGSPYWSGPHLHMEVTTDWSAVWNVTDISQTGYYFIWDN